MTDLNEPPSPILDTPDVKIVVSNENKFRKFLVLASITILLLVGIGSYFLLKKGKKSEIPASQITSTPTVTPTLFPSMIPIPTITLMPVYDLSKIPPSNLASLRGKLLFKKENLLVVTDTDGNNPMLLLKNDNPKFQFAGWSDEGKVIYYTEKVKNEGIVYKKELSSGQITELFTFDTMDSRVPDEYEHERSLQVTVRKDGKYALYIHNGADLSLFDITSGTSKKLLISSPCWGGGENECGPTGKFYSFHSSSWSPDGLKAKVKKTGYEGFETIVFNPFSNSILSKGIEREIGDKMNFNSCPSEWSKDDQMLIFACNGYGGYGLHIINNILNNFKKEDILTNNPEFNNFKFMVFSAVQSNNGEIAFTYGIYPYGTGKERQGIALYNFKDNSIKYLADLFQPEGNSIKFWFPDNRNFLYSKRDVDPSQTIWVFDTVTLFQKQFPIKIDDVIGLVQ